MRLGRVLVAVVASVVVVGVWGTAIHTLLNPKPIATKAPPPTSIVWNDRVFSSTRALRSWIRGHGGNYRQWARRHRAAAAIVAGHAVFRPPPSATTTAAASPPRQRARPHAAYSPGRSTSPVHAVLLALLLVIGSALLVLGLIPVATLRRARWTAWVSHERRAYALMAGIAVLIGCGLANGLQ